MFPDDWEKSNVVPTHKRDSKNLIKNYRPISLLPIFSKIFERLIFNSLFNYFIQNKLFTECQSGFIPGDSCVAQLLSVTHEIYKSFDCNSPQDIRGFGKGSLEPLHNKTFLTKYFFGNFFICKVFFQIIVVKNTGRSYFY